MFTKNFFNYAMVQVASKGTTALTINAIVDQNGVVDDLAFTTASATAFRLHYLTTGEVSTSGGGVKIGSGTTPPTIDDYKLESMITSGFSVTNQGDSSFNFENDHVSLSAVYGITNTSKTAMVISEIGLYGVISSNPVRACLLERTVLEKPITINPGESKQLTYTIRFNYPVE